LEEKADWVCEQWKSNMVAMSRIAAGQSLTVNQLVDMEWRFGGQWVCPFGLVGRGLV